VLPWLCSNERSKTRIYRKERGKIPQIVAKPKVATYNMFEQSDCLSLYKLIDHIAKHRAYCIEPLIGMANIGETCFVQKNLLNNENSHGF
jgi:hypothetical protein